MEKHVGLTQTHRFSDGWAFFSGFTIRPNGNISFGAFFTTEGAYGLNEYVNEHEGLPWTAILIPF